MAMRVTGYHLRIALASALAARLDPFEEVLDEVVEDGGVELVDDLLALSLGDDETGVAELPEVPRDGGPGSWEMVGDFARGLRTVFEETEDVAAGGIGQGFEG